MKRKIFVNRSNNFSLQLHYRMSRQSWSAQQDEAITQLVKEWGLDDWTQISIKLRDYLGMQKRTGKQCRERWYNHLSPEVNKHPWSEEEEEMLFSCHRKYGNRWKDISRLFVGRTDNDIKNHFYSTLRRSLRRLNKIVGEKNSTTQMREIKPSVLSTIMNYIYEQQHAQSQLVESLKDLPILVFEFAKFKPVKLNIRNANIEIIRQKNNEIFNLIAQFNEEYERNKASRKMLKDQREYKKNTLNKNSIAVSDSHQEIEQQPEHINERKEAQTGVRQCEQHTEKTNYSLKHEQEPNDMLEIMTPMILNQEMNSPKSGIKDISQMDSLQRRFSLEADDIDVIHFNEPEQPSCFEIDSNEQFNAEVKLESEKERENSTLLIDEVIEVHFRH